MSYIIPSPLIYQQLANAGGVLNSTPDLEVCIVGPAYNVVKYVVGSAAAQTKTFSDIYQTGKVLGATLPSTKPGQLLEESSINVWLNNAVVEHLLSNGSGDYGDSLVTFPGASSTYIIGAREFPSTPGSSSNIEVTPSSGPFDLVVGDDIVISNGGAGGSSLTTTITAIQANATTHTLTILPGLLSTVNPADTITKVSGGGSTLSPTAIISGDSVVVTYNDISNATKTFSSQVLSPVLNSNKTALIGVRLADVLPLDFEGSGSFSFRRTFYDKLLPEIDPISPGGVDTNYTTDGVVITEEIVLPGVVNLTEGKVISANVHIGYRALRQDLLGSIMSFDNVADLSAQLEDLTDQNPLGLACSLTLANTITRVRAISVASNDLPGYVGALDISEAERLYALVPLTQEQSILAAFSSHVTQMSVPEMASWRIALVSTPIATSKFIGTANDVAPASGATVETAGSVDNILIDSTASFVADGVVAGDTVVISSSKNQSVIGSTTVAQVLNNNMIQLAFVGAKNDTQVTYYIKRIYNRTQQAANVKAASTTFNSKRVINIQPDVVGVSVEGVTKYLPGYYLAAAVGGMVAGFPVQQGFTNIGVAGITDLRHSNYYFTKAQLNTIAEGGTFLFVQDSQGGIPYCRHEMTTDVSVLQYRELLVVKNWDFVSYYFYDKMKPFIGSWNITPDTINTIRQTLNASISLLKGKKLPKIGPPLINGTIATLEQDASNKDTVNVVINIELVYPLNYLAIYLVV